MVQSKYNRFQLGMNLLFCVAFIVGGLSLLRYHHPEPKIVACIILVPACGIFLLFVFFQRAPQIFLDESSITSKFLFKRNVYDWNDIGNVLLSTEAMYSAYIMAYKTEAMKISFRNGNSLLIWGTMYRNMQEMRSVVAQKLDQRLHLVKHTLPMLSLPNTETKYAGNPFLSFNTILVAGMAIGLTALSSMKTVNHVSILVPLSITGIFFLMFGFQMYYFKLVEGNLIVKNHYFPWINTSFRLEEIEQVHTEIPYRQSKGLRIITKQFDSKYYGAGSLGNNKWKELLADLKSIGIKTQEDS